MEYPTASHVWIPQTSSRCSSATASWGSTPSPTSSRPTRQAACPQLTCRHLRSPRLILAAQTSIAFQLRPDPMADAKHCDSVHAGGPERWEPRERNPAANGHSTVDVDSTETWTRPSRSRRAPTICRSSARVRPFARPSAFEHADPSPIMNPTVSTGRELTIDDNVGVEQHLRPVRAAHRHGGRRRYRGGWLVLDHRDASGQWVASKSFKERYPVADRQQRHLRRRAHCRGARMGSRGLCSRIGHPPEDDQRSHR